MDTPSRFSDASQLLHETASEALGGLDDFGLGMDDYREGLDVFLQALDDSQFTPVGREFIWGNLVGNLISRLMAQKGWNERPETLHAQIQKPLIITGIPRTGTTALHKLLSMDPQFQGIELWLSNAPMPRPPREQWGENPYFQGAAKGLEDFKAMVPQMWILHNMVADEVDECLELLKHSFVSNRWGSTYRAPGYDDWFMKQDERASYRRFANTLRLIGANDRGKTWLLKNPGHIWHIDALLEQFPDACIVQTHREPAKSVPSVCSVIHMTRCATEGDKADPFLLGARELEYWSVGTERVMAARDKLGPGRFLDVFHRDFHAEPMTVVRAVYGRFGFVLTDETERRMLQWISENEQVKQHEHKYTLGQFGLSAGQVRERFSNYIDRFDLV